MPTYKKSVRALVSLVEAGMSVEHAIELVASTYVEHAELVREWASNHLE